MYERPLHEHHIYPGTEGDDEGQTLPRLSARFVRHTLVFESCWIPDPYMIPAFYKMRSFTAECMGNPALCSQKVNND
jgi:hypothetical protein